MPDDEHAVPREQVEIESPMPEAAGPTVRALRARGAHRGRVAGAAARVMAAHADALDRLGR